MSPAQLTLLLLRANGITDGTTAWLGFYGTMPDKQDQVVAIFDDDPQQDGMPMRVGVLPFQHPEITIRIRSRDYQTGWAMGKSIVAFLATIVNHSDFSIGPFGALFQVYGLKHGPSYAGREKSQERYFFNVSYRTLIKEY